MASLKDRISQHYLQFISWLKPTLPEPEKELTLLEECEIMVRALDVDKFGAYVSSNGIGITVAVPFATIDAYIEELHIRKDFLTNTYTVLPEHCRWSAHHTKLNDFFITRNGYYQDVQLAVRHFCQAALLLCKAMREAEDATPSAAMYNQRLLTPLLTNIKELTLTLLEINTHPFISIN